MTTFLSSSATLECHPCPTGSFSSRDAKQCQPCPHCGLGSPVFQALNLREEYPASIAKLYPPDTAPTVDSAAREIDNDAADHAVNVFIISTIGGVLSITLTALIL